jgi:hypothetical protein
MKIREEIWRNLLAAGNSSSSSDKELANLVREIARVHDQVGIMQHANELHKDNGGFGYDKPALTDLEDGRTQ